MSNPASKTIPKVLLQAKKEATIQAMGKNKEWNKGREWTKSWDNKGPWSQQWKNKE